MIGTAFETTQEDLEIVLNKFGVNLSEDETQKLFEDEIYNEAARIESTALQAKTTDDDEETLGFQTMAAQEEIAEILMEANKLPAVRCNLCHKLAQTNTAHLHQNHYIGDECCWDEQLRASE